MPFINPENGYLTVINLFKTDQLERVDRLVGEMSRIVDAADYPGWLSSTVHRGIAKHGTLNFIQWRGRDDLGTRYQGSEFKHHTIPVFNQISTYMRLMQTEVEIAQRHPSQGEATEISPTRDDYTVVEILGVAPGRQGDLVASLGAAHDWLLEVPGYRSQSIMRGIRSRRPQRESGDLNTIGADNDFVVRYSQWDSPEAFGAFQALPEDQHSTGRRESARRRLALVTETDWNGYRVVHTRSAQQPAAA
ncbi:MAG TPA: hypothetical protein VH478_21970 [Trebonia sp.]|jgi:heme-degrading monooxygenase HmoA|nr:hypothetical protein [Trebonia sp.]